MNKLVYRLCTFFLSGMLLLAGCSNEIDMIEEGSVPVFVVFGVLNTTDSLQQVKVRTSSVAREGTDNLFSDSSQFLPNPGIKVLVRESWEGQIEDHEFRAVEYPKLNGSFFTTGNPIHEAFFSLRTNRTYRLEVNEPDGAPMVASEIQPVAQARLGAPNWPYIGYSFSDEMSPFNIRLKTVARAYMYLIAFRVHYLEVDHAGDSVMQVAGFLFEPRYYDNPPEYSPHRETFGFDLNKQMPFQYTLNILRRIIPVDPAVDFRQLRYFEVSVWAGDRHLKNFIQMNERFDDDRSLYFNNIQNGVGVFGSCSHVECPGIYPDPILMDSLVNSKLLQPLGFRPGFFRRFAQPSGAAEPLTLTKILSYERE